MVSLWGSKNGEERNDGDETEQDGEDSTQQNRRSGGPEPDERTRLLPPRNDGFLDPDDPAVRAYPGTYLGAGKIIRSLGLIHCIGISLQSLECQSASILLRPLRHHQLPMVGFATGLHLCQPAHDALSWLRLLRLLLHYSHSW